MRLQDVMDQFQDDVEWLESEDEDYVGDEFEAPEDSTMIDPLDQAEMEEDMDTNETPDTSHTDEPSPSVLSTAVTVGNRPDVVFAEDVGPVCNLAEDATALDYFLQIFGEDSFDLLTTQSNLYAEQSPPGISYKWHPTCNEEMKLFIGMILLMGVHKLPTVEDYWSKSPLLHVDAISKCMPILRFKALLRCLHINDNSTAKRPGEDGFDKLHKIRPLYDILRDNCASKYLPHKELSINEGMILFKGRSSYKQYMPMKPVKRGYKVWCEADAHNGYLTSFEMYTGATQGSTEHGLGSSVVKRLSSPLAGKGYHLYFDNFFTSVDLAEDLLKDGLYCIGTARTNRKKWPQEMRDKKRMEKQLKRGEYICTNQGNVGRTTNVCPL